MNNLKYGLGANFYLDKNLVVIGEWVDNNLQGLTINIKENDNSNSRERLLMIDENKQKKEIKDEVVIRKIKESEEYFNLKEFYANIKDLIPNPF